VTSTLTSVSFFHSSRIGPDEGEKLPSYLHSLLIALSLPICHLLVKVLAAAPAAALEYPLSNVKNLI
jgi:hypothetical protein